MLTTAFSSLSTLARGELILDTGLTYDGVARVRIRATKRERRYEFSDDGGAVAAAGVDPGAFSFRDSVPLGEYSVNVSRRGVVSLPGVAGSGEEWLARLPELVAQGSVALYESLLELER